MVLRAQQTVELTRRSASLDNLPTVRVVVPDVKMCPGEEYDLPIYLESDVSPIRVSDFMLGFHFPTYMTVEPVDRGIVTEICDILRSQGSYTATTVEGHVQLPDHTFTFSWKSNGYNRPISIESGQMLFRFRVKCKQKADGIIDLVSHDYTAEGFGDCRGFSYFTWPESDYNQGIVFPIFDTAHVMPAPDPVVKVLPDTVMCVNEQIRFWAEGGIHYEWEDISYVERPWIADAMEEKREQYPLFYPREPGYYTYRCKITDRSGCSGYDTVQCVVRNNSLNLGFIQDTMIDMETPAVLDAEFWGSPEATYTLSWEPASLVETPVMSDLKAASAKEHLRVENRSVPLTDAQWFKVRLEDGYCKLELRQNVNVLGAPISANLTMNPSLFCVDENIKESKTVKLNVVAHGGSGKYTYHWSVESLEAGEPPVFETSVDGPSATLRFYKRCVVHVDVVDFVARAARRFSDTLRFMEATTATIELVDLNEGSSCEQSEMHFMAKTENGGEHPLYRWFINGEEVLKSEEPVFSTYQLTVGDRLHCEMTSDKQCVHNKTAVSEPIYPHVVYPGYMTALPSFGSDAVNTPCGDSLSLGILHRHTGNRFRLRWYRNDMEVLADRYVEHQQMVENESVMDYTMVERGGYYDFYRAAVTESDRACLIDDSLVTMAMYPRLAPRQEAQVGPVYVHPDDAAGVCTGRSFMVYARDVRYLPSEFRLVWYVKKAGEAQATAKGYYATSGFSDNEAYGRNLGASSEFAAADDYFRTQNWLLQGFPLSVSTAVEVVAGDSVYYRLETLAGCVQAIDKTSARYVVRTKPTIETAPSADFATVLHPSDYCEGASIRFYPKAPSSDKIRYTWFVGGRQINEVYPGLISGDTLTTKVYNNLEIKLQAHSLQQCLSPSVPRTTEHSITIKDMYDGFMTMAAKDTMVCADAPVSLWAVGLPYKGNERPVKPETVGVPGWLPNYEDKVKVEWAESRADAVAGRFIHTGLVFGTSVDSARFGDRSGDLYEDSAVVGTQTFVARLTSSNGCVGYDSVRVTVGYRRRPSVVVVPEPAFPWCEGNTAGTYLKLRGEFWGKKPLLAMWCTQPGGYEDWSIQQDSVWTYDPGRFKKGRPIQGGVLSSMLTCTEREIFSDSLFLNMREKPEAWVLRGDRTVCQGDELTVVGYGCTAGEYDRLSGMGYSEDEMMAELAGEYDFSWVDETSGETVSEERILVVRPERATRYKLVVRDKAHRCVEATATVNVRVALKTGVDIVFTDVTVGKEVPFSICEGSDSVEFYCRVVPRTAVGPGAYLGFTVVDIATGQEKDQWFQYDMNERVPVKFYPGERLVYYCIHDTLSCDNSDYAMDSVDLHVGRSLSPLFRAEPDTMLCKDERARLSLSGAIRDASSLYAGGPSLKAYLEAQGIADAVDMPGQPMVYWWPSTGLDDRYSFAPMASSNQNHVYRVCGYNEYGCLQTDSVRVEHFESDMVFKLVLRAADTLLCDTDSLSFSLDRYESSILTIFDSLLWKRVRMANPSVSALRPAEPEVLAVNTDRIRVDVAHGDTVYVEGFVTGKGLCEQIPATWFTSNKVGIRSYRRPSVSLSQVDVAACVDSTLELRAHVEEGALLRWTFGLENGGGVGAIKPQYEILDGGRPNPFMAWAKLRTYESFTAIVASYYDSSCMAFDSIPVEVKRDIDTLRIGLSDVPSICGDGLAEIKVLHVDNAETWRWWLNGRPMLAADVTDENGHGVSFLGSRMDRIHGRFNDGDVIKAEARTSERCVYLGQAESNAVRIKRSDNPLWYWLEPIDTTGGMAAVSGCSGDPLMLRLLVERGDGLQAEWLEDGIGTDKKFIFEEMTPQGRIYSLDANYPTVSHSDAGFEKTAVLSISLGYEDCSAVDSVRITAGIYETVEVEIAVSAASVCEGEEVTYRLSRWVSADSVVWYLNDEPVLAGRLPGAVEYVCRPAAGDRVYVQAYNVFNPCVVNNGLLSNELTVEVLSGGVAAAVEAALTASADSVCGAGAPTYTVSGRGFDSVYWYANGLLSAVTDLLGDATSAPEARTAAWKRVPRAAAEGADSVYAVAVRRDRICAPRESLRTASVSVYRREMPEVRIAPRDTAVAPGDDLALQASGATAYVWWTDADDGIAGKEAAFTLTASGDTVLVYVMGYEPAYGPDSLAGGRTPAPAPEAYGEFACRAFDSVCVRPGAERRDGPVVYVPNAVLRNSARPADRVFKVFGEGIASVDMRIYNHGGDLIFEKTAEDPVWKPGDVTAGNYTYRLVITLQNGGEVKKNGWISVLD